MKILFSCLSKSWGGMEMVVLTEINHLLQRKEKVELLCIKESRIHIEARRLGIVIHPIRILGKLHPFASVKTASIISSVKYDVIHTHASKDLWILAPALQIAKSRTPLVLTKHVGSYIIKKDFLHRKLYSRVNKVIAISNAIIKNLLDTLPIKEKDVVLIHNGIDTAKFDSSKTNRQKIRDAFKIGSNELLIGMLARFSPGKGHEEFISAATALKKKYNNLKFMVVGEASRGEEDYMRSVKEFDYKNQTGIIFTGFRNDTPDVLSAMDIFAFPSHSESFGIALAEALSAGVPSVCSDTEGVPDIAVDKVTSLFFKVKDASDLAAKLEKLICSPDLRTSFSSASRKRAVELFDIQTHMDKLISLYRIIQNK